MGLRASARRIRIGFSILFSFIDRRFRREKYAPLLVENISFLCLLLSSTKELVVCSFSW